MVYTTHTHSAGCPYIIYIPNIVIHLHANHRVKELNKRGEGKTKREREREKDNETK